MKITIQIESDNDAFRHPDTGDVDMPTIALNLHEVCRMIADGQFSGALRDSNGNTAIRYNITD